MRTYIEERTQGHKLTDLFRCCGPVLLQEVNGVVGEPTKFACSRKMLTRNLPSDILEFAHIRIGSAG